MFQVYYKTRQERTNDLIFKHTYGIFLHECTQTVQCKIEKKFIRKY